MRALAPVSITLSGHLTSQALQREFDRLTPRLVGEGLVLVVDALEMTGYEGDARDMFVKWISRNRSQLSRVAVITDRGLWRMVIAAMSLASGREVRPFSGRSEALAWASTQPAPEPITMSLHAGRLLEFRISKLTSSEIPMLKRLFAESRELVPHGRIVTIIDLRMLKGVSQDVVASAVGLAEWGNLRMERGALIVHEEGKLMLSQAERVVQNANNASRRVFCNPEEAEAYLGDVLTDQEKARLSEFLRGG